MRALAFGLIVALSALGGRASAVELLGGTNAQQSLHVQRNLQAAQQQAIENRLRRQIYQSEQRLIRELDRRDVQQPHSPQVPDFVPSCRAPVSGAANVPLRCR